MAGRGNGLRRGGGVLSWAQCIGPYTMAREERRIPGGMARCRTVAMCGGRRRAG